MLATDGCVTGDRIVLDFSEENKELLSYWNEFLGNKCNINTSIHKVFKVPQYRIAFKNPDIAQYLTTFGIVPRKTFDLQLKYYAIAQIYLSQYKVYLVDLKEKMFTRIFLAAKKYCPITIDEEDKFEDFMNYFIVCFRNELEKKNG